VAAEAGGQGIAEMARARDARLVAILEGLRGA